MAQIRLRYILGNALPAYVMFFFATIHFMRFLKGGGTLQISHILLIAQTALAGILFVVRLPAQSVSWKLWDVFVSLFGTFFPSFFSLENHAERVYGLVIQGVGNLLAIYSLLCLGKSMGILPANRGIKTHGIYRFVRHPLYFSYQISNIGYIINHPDGYNYAVAAVCLMAQLLRIFREEALLQEDAGYRQYQKQVKWKLVPYIF